MTAEVGVNLIKNRSGSRWEQYSMLRSGRSSLVLSYFAITGRIVCPSPKAAMGQYATDHAVPPASFPPSLRWAGREHLSDNKPPSRLQVLEPPTV